MIFFVTRLLVSLTIFVLQIATIKMYSQDIAVPFGNDSLKNRTEFSSLNHVGMPENTHKLKEGWSLEKSWLFPVSEIIFINFGVASWNRWITHQDWAKIGPVSIKKNFEEGFDWDHDKFQTNFFEHPYHGNLYFNTARSNGWSFVGSIPYTLGGSLMWEYFMENTRPSWNDLFNTTVSGFTLGEVTYRLSSLLIRKKNGGVSDFVMETLSALLNPVQFVNRLCTGELFKGTFKNGMKENVESEFYGTFGCSFFPRARDKSLFMGLNINYGDPFSENKYTLSSFDFFRINAILINSKHRELINNINVASVLLGERVVGQNIKDKKPNIAVLGIFQHYDYWQNVVYRLGGLSIGPGVISRIFLNNSKNAKIVSRAFINFMPLGATDAIGISKGNEREKNYAYCFGANLKSEARFDWKFLDLYLLYDIFWYHIPAFANDGASGNEIVGIFRPKIILTPFGFISESIKNLMVGSEYLFYHREGIYKPYPPLDLSNYELRFFLGYKFEI